MDQGIRDRMSEGTDVSLTGCAGCVSRRAFLADAAALAAVAALFTACSEAGLTPPTGKVEVKVSDFPGLATINQLVLIDATRAAKRTSESSFTAWSRFCTHEGTPVDISGSGFSCANHGSRFDNSGNVTLGPATQALNQLATSFDAATGILTIG
jgi:cytochrome b6-f complex iron-sulfur subunit